MDIYLFLLCIAGCIYGFHARLTEVDGRQVWSPNHVDRDTFISCRGIPCEEWERRQTKFMKLKAFEMKDGDDDYYTEEDKIVKNPQYLNRETLRDLDLDGGQWWSEDDIDEALDVETSGKDILYSRKKRKVHGTFSERDLKWSMPIIYRFDGSHSEKDKRYIRRVLHHFQDQTCIRFKEVDIQEDYERNHLVFVKDYQKCHSWVGMQNHDAQIVALVDDDCMYDFGKVAREIGYALGMWNEHQRSDRDDYVDVNFDNIGNTKVEFLKQKTQNFDTTYDFGSVMHYSWHEGTKNGKYTIVPKMKNPKYKYYLHNMGQRTGLSFNDAKGLNNAYCANTCRRSLGDKCQHNGYGDPNDCTKCRCLPAYSGDFCQDISPSNDECGGKIFVDDRTYIATPNYPDKHYRNHIQCTWHITTSPGSRLQLSFESPFSVFAKNRGVCHHWVEIMYQGDLDEPGARFCGMYRPLTKIHSEANEMIVMLRANYTISSITERLGFKLTLEKFTNDGGKSRDIGTESYKFSCSFENGEMCEMVQDNKDDFDWVTQTGGTPSSNTGPNGAQDGQYYLFIEASDRENGDRARIRTPAVPTDGKYCLTFYYNMHGRYVNRLRVFAVSSDRTKKQWEERGDQGEDWHSANVEAKLDRGGMFEFEAIRGKGYSGDIAIDNIEMSRC